MKAYRLWILPHIFDLTLYLACLIFVVTLSNLAIYLAFQLSDIHLAFFTFLAFSLAGWAVATLIKGLLFWSGEDHARSACSLCH